jgi:hypothetical protein
MAARQRGRALGEGQHDSDRAPAATIRSAFVGSRVAPVQTPPRDSEKPGRNGCDVTVAGEKSGPPEVSVVTLAPARRLGRIKQVSHRTQSYTECTRSFTE